MSEDLLKKYFQPTKALQTQVKLLIIGLERQHNLCNAFVDETPK